MGTYLVIDTATDAMLCALVSGNITAGHTVEVDVPVCSAAQWDTLAQTIIPTTRDHVELLIPSVQELLHTAEVTADEIEAIVIGNGPGPFTGLRVGIATGVALAQAWSRPVYRACSLDALLYTAWERSEHEVAEGSIVWVITDARRKEWYVAEYTVRHQAMHRVHDPIAVSPAVVDFTVPSVVVVPDTIAAQLAGVAGDVEHIVCDHPHGVALCQVAIECEPGSTVTPIYCRKPDAVEGKGPKKVVPQQ